MPAPTTPPPTTPPPSRPSLPSAFMTTTPAPALAYQGAEALLYRTHFLTPTSNLPSALKHRPSKPYRHPTLDAKLTRHRILAEARALVKLRREGVRQVPAVYALDWEQGWMMCEWVEGATVRACLDNTLPGFLEEGAERGLGEPGLWGLMGRIGRLVGRVHEKGVVHGDLTTSNLMVRPEGREGDGDEAASRSYMQAQLLSAEGEVVLIDFGLAAQSTQDEDRAVDLYVLERAFGSTHPKTEELWKEVLRAYGDSYKGARVVVKRLEEVRMRGRKKIMIG